MKVNDNHYKYTIETKNEEGSVVDFQEIETVEPIRSVRDVYDELDLENNIQIKRIEEIIFNSESSEYWYIDEARSQGDYVVAYIEDMNLMCNPSNPFCDTSSTVFEYGNFTDNAYLDKNFFCAIVEDNGMSRIYMKLLKSETGYSQFTNDVIREYLSNNPVTVWYVLAQEVVIPRSLAKGYLLTQSGSTTINVQPQTLGKVSPIVKAKVGEVSVEMDSTSTTTVNNTGEGTQLTDLTLEGVSLVNNAQGDNIKGTKEVSHTRYNFAPFYDGSTTINNTVEGGHVSAKLYGDTMINIAKPYGETALLTATNESTLCNDLLGANEEGVILTDGELTEGRIYGDTIKTENPTFKVGNLAETTGEVSLTVTTNMHTDMIEVPSRVFTLYTGRTFTKIAYYDANRNFISCQVSVNVATIKAEIPSNAKYVRYGVAVENTSENNFTWKYEDGTDVYRGIKSVVNPTVQFTNIDSSLSLQATFPYTLNKLPNGVADYIDVVNKVHVQMVGKFVADGVEDTLALETYNVGEGYIKFKTEAFISRHADGAENFICDKLPYNSKSHNNSNEVGFRGAGGNSPYWIMFCIEDAPLATKDLNGLRAYLQSNPITVLYELATPIYTPLTEEEIAQLPLSAYKDGYVTLSSDQLTPSMDLRMRASNRYQIDMLEANSYYYLNAPVGNIKLGRETVDVTSMPCIIKTGTSLSGDSDYRLGLSNEVRESIIELTFGGYINNNNGSVITSTQDAYTPEYLSLEDYGLTTLFSLTSCENVREHGIVFVLFNEEKQLIRAYSSETEIVNEAIPTEAKYFKVSVRTKNSNNPKAKIVNMLITLAKLPSHRIPSSFTQGMKCATDFGYWEGIKEAQIWSLGTYNSSWSLVDNIFTTGLENAGTLNRLEGTYQTSAIIEDEFDYATGKLTKRVGKLELNSTNVEAISYINVPSKEYLYVSLYGYKLGGNFGTSLTTNKNYGVCITDKTSFNVSYNGDFNHSFIAGGNIVLYLKINEFGGIPTIESIRDYFSKHPLTIYYEMAVPEISYITDLPKNYVTTITPTTNFLANVEDKNLYLFPQCKPSLLSYPTLLTPNTQYTVIHNRKNYDGSVKTPMINLGGTQVLASGSRTVITTPSTLSHSELRFIGGENTVEQVMVLHGDWTKDNKDVDYFEGIQHSIIGDKILENLVDNPVGVNISTTANIVSVNDAINDDKVHTKDGLFKSAILEGMTLVNLMPTYDRAMTLSSDYSDFYAVGQASYIYSSGLEIMDAKALQDIKPNTTYTLIYNIVENTLSTGGYHLNNAGSNTIFPMVIIKQGMIGWQKTTFTSHSDLTGRYCVLRGQNGMGRGTLRIKDVMLIEGDYTNVDIPYFEGMKSVKMPVLTTTGKNICDMVGLAKKLNEISNKIVIIDESTWEIKSTVDYADFKYRPVKFKENTPYTITFEGKTDESRDNLANIIKIVYTDGTSSNMRNKGFNKLTTSSNKTIDYIYISYGVVDIKETISNLSIVEGESTTYEPYKSNILSTPSDLELRGIGDVKDELNCLTGEVTERICEIVLDGSEEWVFNTVNDVTINFYCGGFGSKSSSLVMCDKLKSEKYDGIRTSTVGGFSVTLDGNLTGVNTLDTFKTWLQNNKLTVAYPLETPIIKTVDLTSSGNWEKIVYNGKQNLYVNSTWSSGDILACHTDTVENKLVGGMAYGSSLQGMNYNEGCVVNNVALKECIKYDSGSAVLYILIKKSKLPSPDANGLKQYLSQNPETIWYQTTSHKDSTQVKQPILFKDGHIQLSSGGLLPNAELTVPTTNKYQLDLDRLKYTVITKQGFTFNGSDYSASATGLNVIDIVDVVNNALYSDDENITVVQENANSYEDGILTQFKGTKVFAKNFIDTTNSIKRSAMKMVEPLELQGIPGGAADTYDVLTGVVARRVNTLHFKDLTFGYSVINDNDFKKYSYMLYTHDLLALANTSKKYISNILPNARMNVDSTERGFYFSSGNQLVVWQIGNEVDTLKQYLEENDFTVTYELAEPQIIKPDEMKPYISTRPENGTIESLDSKLQTEYLKYDNEQSILSPRMLGEGDTIRWEQGSQCYVFENDKEYIPLEDYREPFGSNLDAKDVEQYIENVEGAKVELGIALKEKGVYERTFVNNEDGVIYSTELDNIDEQRGTEVEYICGATWQNPNDLSDIRHVGALRPDGQYDVNIVRSGDDEIRLLDGTTNISLNGDGLNPSEFELTYFSSGGAELGKYGDTSHVLEDTVKDSKLESGTVYGDTLVNLLDTTQFWLSSSTVTRDGDGWITVPGSGSYVPCRHKYQGNLKTDTLYTLIVDVKSNTCSGALYLIDKTSGGEAESAFTLYGYNIPSKETGRFVQTVITKSDLSGVNCDFRGTLSASAKAGESIVFRYMLIEGDHTSDSISIPYFEGIGSTVVNGFTTVGKNLLDLTGKDFDNKDVVGTVCSLHNGIFTIKGLSRGSGGRTSLGNGITFLFKKGKTYTLSIDVIENNATTVPLFYFSRYDNSSTYISTRANNNPGTITATEDVLAYIGYNVEKDFYYDCKVKVQIEYGTQATEFEPYQSEIQYTLPTPITLNKVGDVADTFNVVSGVETRKLEKIVFDDNVDYYVTTFNNTTKYYYVYTSDFDSVITDNAHTDRDYIATVPYAKIGVTSGSESSEFDSLGDITFTCSNSGTKVKFIIEKSLLDNYGLASNTENAKAYFRDNPVDVIITRKTPQTIQHTLIPSHQPVEYPTFILPQPLRSVPNGICDRLYWDENKGHYCIEKRIYDYTITGVNDVGLMDSGTSLMVYAYGDTSITNDVLNLNSGNVSYADSYSYNNKFGNKVYDVITGGSTVEAISPFNGYMYYRLLASRVGTTLDSIKAWFNENPTTVYMPLATPQIIDLPHLNRKLEMPTLVDGLPLGFKVEHEKANPQLGLTIPYKVLNMPKQPTDLSFVMRDNQIGDYILTWSEIKEARQYNIILNDSVIATTKEPSYNTGEEIYGYILVEAQNELGENLSKELYVKTVPNAPAQLTVAHNPNTNNYDFDISFISTSAIADYYTVKYCIDNGEWVEHRINAIDIPQDTKVLYQFSIENIEDNIQVHATATNDIGTNDILPVATYYMSPTPQWTYRINSKEAFIRWIDNSPYDVKYKVRYSYLSEGVYKYAYFEGDTTEVGKMYELMLPLAEDDELTVSICIVSEKENLYCKPVKMSKSLDPNIVPPINFKYRWLARGLIEFSWEDNYEVDVKYEYVLEHKLSDETEWQSITNEIVAEDVQGKGTVYRVEYQLQDLEQIRVKVRMLWAMNETEWTETLATVFIPVEGNPPTWIKRTQTQEGLLVQWEAQAYVDSYHLYITDAEGNVLEHVETLDDFILLDIDYDNPIELHIYEKTRFSGGIESDPTDEMVFTPTSYRTTHLMNVYKPCAEEYEMEVATIQKGSKETYVINDVTYTPNVKTTGDVVTSISSPFQISYHPLGIDVHQAGSKAYAPLDLSVRTLDVRNKYQFDIMTFERITDKYGMNFNVYTPSVASYPITLEVSKVRIVCLGDSLTSGYKDNRLVG